MFYYAVVAILTTSFVLAACHTFNNEVQQEITLKHLSVVSVNSY